MPSCKTCLEAPQHYDKVGVLVDNGGVTGLRKGMFLLTANAQVFKDECVYTCAFDSDRLRTPAGQQPPCIPLQLVLVRLRHTAIQCCIYSSTANLTNVKNGVREMVSRTEDTPFSEGGLAVSIPSHERDAYHASC